MATNATENAEVLTQPVRNALKKMVLDLRALLEEDYRKQLVSLGFRDGVGQALPAGRVLSEPDQRAREVAAAVIKREVAGGAKPAEAADTFVRDSAFTFLNRAFGLRCLEARGLLLVDGQAETVFAADTALGASSLYWRVRNQLPPATSPREVWREALRRACAAISQQVKVLFDPESEYAALFPQQATVQKVAEALNAPEVPATAYAQDELLGWVYQYYNTQEKQKVYDKLGKGGKIERPEELAAATCLYTERYMVDYLLQNTLGALWVEMHPRSQLPKQWPYYVKPPAADVGAGASAGPAATAADSDRPNPPAPISRSLPLSGLRPTREGGVARPAKPLREVTLLDPACGSGHFLVRAFDLLVAMYREEGREAEAEIPHLILERNLHGLDIDLRAVQIAALALYLKGCALAGPGFRPRRLNLVPADVLLPGAEPPQAYLARFKGDRELLDLVKAIWSGLRNVRVFGSLLHPERAVDEVIRRRRDEDQRKYPLLQRGDEHWHQWKRDLLAGLQEEFERQAQSADLGQRLFGQEAAKGVSLVEVLGGRYDVVVANPPYQGSDSLPPELKDYLKREYKGGKEDLYAAFILRCRGFCAHRGLVGMVAQQSWMFLRSFAGLRKDTLENTSLKTIAHLGPHAFGEIGGEVVNCALFTLRAGPPPRGHRLVGFRLVGPKSAGEKNDLLSKAVGGAAAGVVSTPSQSDFTPIPETPFVYWLRPRFFELLRTEDRLGGIADVRQGLSTADQDRFTRAFWEVAYRNGQSRKAGTATTWFRYARAGGYHKWRGLDWVLVDWEENGRRIRDYPGAAVRNEGYYFKPGLCYSVMARGSMGARLLDDSVFSNVSDGIFPKCPDDRYAICALLSNRLASYLLRTVTQDLKFESGYVREFPLPPGADYKMLDEPARACIQMKTELVRWDPLERSFLAVLGEGTREAKSQSSGRLSSRAKLRSQSLVAALLGDELGLLDVQAALHSVEGWNENLVCSLFGLSAEDIESVWGETGSPAASQPLIPGYHMPPQLGDDTMVQRVVDASLQNCSSVQPGEAFAVRDIVRISYAQQPTNGDSSGDDAEVALAKAKPIVHGGRIRVPPESRIEAIAETVQVHPVSVYWLLKEMREQEGLVSPPELKRQIEDYASVSVLRLLGYRWPEQDAYEQEHGPILDPRLVDDDGIIPLDPCGGNEPLAVQLLRSRLVDDFGEEGAEKSLQEFRQWVGRDLDDWLKKDFFKRHVTQFKQRPIAWHLVSPERTFEAFVLYHKLSRETLQKLRAQYAGGLLAQLRAEQERARAKGETARARELQLQIEDVEEFRSRLEKIERGDERKYRIRCRWKGETETGRPGPYAPDIDDGVKVNIRPFQEAGLLAVKEVIKKW
ncbi:MAG: BREX-1 system adenine-specific DNA-methyltransferase PglX [Chloroflexi bacterium]|nr:BREX-1 system adenine-specific DNA-methyltransferase PglX [Bacteroidota bacterium]MCL5110969.1 BREX-1 system adenine-specific DNA-methyltransferase PglX [Chloroflexota bacterium]